MGETPSALMHASASSLAKLGAFMANKGVLGETRILNEDIWHQFHSDCVTALDFGINARTNFS